METNVRLNRSGSHRPCVCMLIATTVVAALWAKPVMVGAQIYVDTFAGANSITGQGGTIYDLSLSGTVVNAIPVYGSEPGSIALSGSNLYVAIHNANPSYIGEYSASGGIENADLISGFRNLALSGGLAVSGSDLFVADYGTGVIGEYTTSGATVNASLVTGLVGSYTVAVSGTDLFVGSYPSDTIGEYTISGTTVNADLISTDAGVGGIVVSGSDLFVLSEDGGVVSEYTTSGTLVQSNLIQRPGGISGIAVSGDDIFVVDYQDGEIAEYTTSGAVVNADLATLPEEDPFDFGIAVDASAVPEPSSFGLIAISSGPLLARRRRKRAST